MKQFILLAALFAAISSIAQINPNHTYVNGYTRSDGTYVKPYYRTSANSTINDNFSTVGNTNPYTGQAGHVSREYNTTTTPVYFKPDQRLVNPVYHNNSIPKIDLPLPYLRTEISENNKATSILAEKLKEQAENFGKDKNKGIEYTPLQITHKATNAYAGNSISQPVKVSKPYVPPINKTTSDINPVLMGVVAFGLLVFFFKLLQKY